MFSANENIQLRQYKRRIVENVEACIPEHVLDMGANVMVMQVTCKAPGCVPLETNIVIVFPPSSTELLPGLSESAGGSYKTKVLKPMAEVTKQDVLEALPPTFEGGLRSPEKLALSARDVMLAQITQLFGDDDLEGRTIMAQYLQQSLQDYIDRDCTPPEWGEPFPPTELPKKEDGSTTAENGESLNGNSEAVRADTEKEPSPSKEEEKPKTITSGSGNLVIRRPRDDDYKGISNNTTSATTASAAGRPSASSTTAAAATASQASSSSSSSLVNSVTRRRQQEQATRKLNNNNANNNANATALNRLMEREHAPGIRRPGCPCCDPDNPSNVVDQMMQL